MDIAGCSTVSGVGNTTRLFGTAGSSRDLAAAFATVRAAGSPSYRTRPAILGRADEVIE